MSFIVYILFSTSCNKFYTGQTQDFDNRIIEHNSGETKSLKSGIPWTIVWRTELPTRSEAMALRKKIKSRGAYRFLTDLGIAVFRFMNFTVYLLFSQFCNKFYTGQTQGFDNRIIEHNSGETKSLKSGSAGWPPVKKNISTIVD